MPEVHAQQIRFVFMSDPHYGLECEFRGHEASAEEVNRIMAGTVGSLDFIVCGGDIANRMEDGVQPAAVSWQQFAATWLVPDMPPVRLLAGNHDLSNAIGYVRPLSPERDATCAAEIYNRTMQPDTLRTGATFDYATDKVIIRLCCRVSGLPLPVCGPTRLPAVGWPMNWPVARCPACCSPIRNPMPRPNSSSIRMATIRSIGRTVSRI